MTERHDEFSQRYRDDDYWQIDVETAQQRAKDRLVPEAAEIAYLLSEMMDWNGDPYDPRRFARLYFARVSGSGSCGWVSLYGLPEGKRAVLEARIAAYPDAFPEIPR